MKKFMSTTAALVAAMAGEYRRTSRMGFGSAVPQRKRSNAVRVPGAGTLRRMKRERQIAERNASIPDGSRYTRQQARAAKRAIKKDLRSARKAFMMEYSFPGGAAEVR